MSTSKKQRLEEAPTAAAAEHSVPAASAPSGGAAPEAVGSSSTTIDLWPLISDWVQAKRSAGATPAAVLDSLGLQLTREATTRDEDSVWAMVALVVAEYRQRLEPRRRLKEMDTLENVVQLLRSRSNILVLTRPPTPDDSHPQGWQPPHHTLTRLLPPTQVIIGAGASAATGIPDFRKLEGVHKEVAERFQLPGPLSLFDAHYFVTNPLALCLVAKSLLPGVHPPSRSHRFVRALEARGKLLRGYTENIDGLEAAAGVERVVACHGSVATATCLACKHRVNWTGVRARLEAEAAPRCDECSHALNLLKPDLSCYGETGADLDARLRDDLGRAGALVVLGAGLRVHPLATIPALLDPSVPQILIGPEAVLPAHAWDVHLQGDCDEVIDHLCAALEWDLPLAPAPLDAVSAADDSLESEEADSAAATALAESSGEAAGASATSAAPLAAPRFAPPNRYVFGACGDGAEVGAQTPLAVHHAATYPKQLRRSYSSSAPSSWEPKPPASCVTIEDGADAPSPQGKQGQATATATADAPIAAASSSNGGTSVANGT